MASALRSIRAQGRSLEDKYDNRVIGVNSRLDTLQAAILLTKLEAFIEYELRTVNEIAERYTELLSDIVQTPFVPHGYYSSWAQYTIKLESRERRDLLQSELKENGIPSMVYYPRPLHTQTVFADLGYQPSLFPNSRNAAETVLSLPMHPYLGELDVIKVCQAVRAFLCSDPQ